jgi:hypothetical protein
VKHLLLLTAMLVADLSPAEADRIVGDALRNPAIQACYQRNAPRFRTVDPEDPNALADLVTACASEGKAFVKSECGPRDSTCRVAAGAAMFFIARDAVMKARSGR